MNNRNIPLFTPWSILLLLLALGAVGVAIGKLLYGLGAVTNLSDEWPWGLWVAFDVGVYIATAAGGFALAALVYIFKLEKFRPLVRPAILIGALCYTIGAIGIFVDLGRSIRIVHPLWMWQPESIMFEVSWCVMCYVTVLYLEFSPNIFERFNWQTLKKLQHFLVIPLVIAGILFSFLHQSSLGALFMIAPDMHPLWYGHSMGYWFLISAVAMGLSLVVLASILTSKVWKMPIRMDLLSKVGLGIAWVSLVYIVWRVAELGLTGHLADFTLDEFGLAFIGEIGLGLAIPMLILFSNLRKKMGWLVTATSLVFLAVISNRLMTLVIAHAPARTGSYFPSWTEFLFTFGLIAGAAFIFRLGAKYLPLFSEHNNGLDPSVPKDESVVIPA
jgi:Ni/Fe-hydrogenase subunit HybB-like protein